MKYSYNIQINFRGGIISPGDLLRILEAASEAEVINVRFGLRQQLLMDVMADSVHILQRKLEQYGILYEIEAETHPNIVSSYPAEEVFINNTWLSEGVYKDIFDAIDYQPRLKINISDSNQSFTPLLTGNINWVAAVASPHFWHLFIRLPKTNEVFEYNELIYTNDLALVSAKLEEQIFAQVCTHAVSPQAKAALLFSLLKMENYITRPEAEPARLPQFNLPYYEGLNRYHDKYWLGIYRRDEKFRIDFLKDLCRLCLQTKIGLICSTPWKSLIIKNIEEKDKVYWNDLLAKHKISMRHAANELNFQVEDNCADGLAIKEYLLEYFHKDDTRTFGVCIGIKTRRKSEVFSSILVHRKPLLRIGSMGLFHVYDILCAHEFNPNERTGFAFSRNNLKFFMAEQLSRAVFLFQTQQNKKRDISVVSVKKEISALPLKPVYVHQCTACFTVYDEAEGEPQNSITQGTKFDALPRNYGCPVCDAGKKDFVKIEKKSLGLQAI
jgi:rubredoxin